MRVPERVKSEAMKIYNSIKKFYNYLNKRPDINIINFEIVNKTICLCARRASGKSVTLKYIINKNKSKFDTMFLVSDGKNYKILQ